MGTIAPLDQMSTKDLSDLLESAYDTQNLIMGGYHFSEFLVHQVTEDRVVFSAIEEGSGIKCELLQTQQTTRRDLQRWQDLWKTDSDADSAIETIQRHPEMGITEHPDPDPQWVAEAQSMHDRHIQQAHRATPTTGAPRRTGRTVLVSCAEGHLLTDVMVAQLAHEIATNTSVTRVVCDPSGQNNRLREVVDTAIDLRALLVDGDPRIEPLRATAMVCNWAAHKSAAPAVRDERSIQIGLDGAWLVHLRTSDMAPGQRMTRTSRDGTPRVHPLVHTTQRLQAAGVRTTCRELVLPNR